MRPDERIKTDVVDQMAWDNRIDASNISVRVDGGRVELDGTVPRTWARWAAEDDAWVVEGVTDVENRLQLEFPATVTAPSDTDIEADVRQSLALSPALDGNEIDVSASGGLVTLEGSVDALWKKVQAEKKAMDVRGVVGIINKVTVVPTESLADEIIAKDVVDAVDRNLSVRAEDVDVTVSNGRVTLNGTVPSTVAKTAAYNSALFTSGVTAVEDRLVVDYRA